MRNYVAVDLETYNPDTNEGSVDPWNGKIRLISITTSTFSYVVDLKRDDSVKINAAFSYLRKCWKDPNTTLVNVKLGFDCLFLMCQFPAYFDIKELKASLMSLDLVLKCLIGDYSDPQESAIITRKKKEISEDEQAQQIIIPDKENKNRNQVNPYGFSLMGLLQFYNKECDYESDKKFQKARWGDELTEEHYNYALQDTASVLKILFPLIMEDYERKRQSSTLDDRASVNTVAIESKFLKSSLQLSTAKINVDERSLDENIITLENHVDKLLDTWCESIGDLRPTQTKKLAINWKLPSVSKMQFLDLPDEWTMDQINLFELRVKIVTANKLLKELRKLKLATKDGYTRALWNSCNGTGRCTSYGRKTNFLNLQAIGSRPTRFSPPIDFRKLIVPRDGHVLLNLDLPTSHMRIAFSLSNCQTAQKFLRQGVDVHSYVAAMLFAQDFKTTMTWQELKSLTKEKSENGKQAKMYRDFAKEVMFARLNGSGAKNITKRLSAKFFKRVELPFIDGLVKIIDRTYPELGQFRSRVWQQCLDSCVIIDDVPHYRFVIDELLPANYHYLPFLAFVGQYPAVKWDETDQRYNPDLDKPYQPKYTQVIASIWTRIEALMMKDFIYYVQTNYPQWTILLHHYDSNLFEIPINDFMDAKKTLTKIFDEFFARILLGRIPTGILEQGYLDELVPARSWYEA